MGRCERVSEVALISLCANFFFSASTESYYVFRRIWVSMGFVCNIFRYFSMATSFERNEFFFLHSTLLLFI